MMSVIVNTIDRFFDFFSRAGAAVTAPSNASLISRINRYRGAGHSTDGLHTLYGYQVDDLDYALMAADNSCARIMAGGKEHTMGQWFAIKKNSNLSKKSFGNSHGSSDDGGKTFYNENAYMSIPRLEFRVSPEEVIWHRNRVDELRGQGVPQPDRVRIMTAERASEPWK